MEAFFGTWKVNLDKTTGVAEIGKLFGWTEEKQKMFATLQYSMLLEAAPEDKNRCLLDYGNKTLEFTFKIGEPFDYVGIDGTQAKCTATLEGTNKLIDKYVTADGASWQTVREVSGDTMKTTTTFDGFPEVACCQELSKA